MKFKIEAKSVSYHSAEIEAKSFDDAKDIYEEMDGDEFDGDPYGDWELETITCKKTQETRYYGELARDEKAVFPELDKYKMEDGAGYVYSIPRENETSPTVYLGEHEVIFDAAGDRYYFYCVARDMDAALALFFKENPHISYSMIVDHVEV